MKTSLILSICINSFYMACNCYLKTWKQFYVYYFTIPIYTKYRPNASGEESFSVLKRVNNYRGLGPIRNLTDQDRLGSLASLCIESAKQIRQTLTNK